MDTTRIAVEIFNKCASQYQEKFMDLDLYHDTFDLFCAALTTENAAILEIACGPGNITRYMLWRRPDFKILGTDLAPKMLELAAMNNPSATFEPMDCRDIDKLEEVYHGIMAGFCLPYLSKEEAIKLIADASNRLLPEGILYLSTMEDDYSKSGFKASNSNPENVIFIYYHQADYLRQALEDNGFELLNIQRKDYPEQNGDITKDLVMIARKKQRHF